MTINSYMYMSQKMYVITILLQLVAIIFSIHYFAWIYS